jgi:deazaflavin-dependent oxidoreductase (nitroreductase family)
MTEQNPLAGKFPHPQEIPNKDMSLLAEAHVRVYRETNGERGYVWNGVPILLVTTQGRKSGQPRTIPIIYTPVEDKYVIIASKGGWPTHPSWYLNLLEAPNVEVQIKAEVFKAVARTVEGEERERLWKASVKTWREYDLYQSWTPRRIPVVAIERLHDHA